MSEPIKETRQIDSTWDLTAYKWKVEVDAMRLLMQGFKEKKVLGRKCPRCGTVYVPGPTYCRKCAIEIDLVVELPDTGKIGAFSVNLADIRGNPAEEIVINVFVQIDGSDSYFMGRLADVADWKTVKRDMPVKIVWADTTEGKLADILHFSPA